MKTNVLFMLLLTPFICFSQLIEDFSDGNFTHNPTWIGMTDNFIVNKELQLQSAAKSTSISYLFTSSRAIENAVWECYFKVNHTTSASNYACMYIISNRSSLENGLKGYFVQVGGTNDEVSLFYQDGNKKQKIIDGEDKRTDGKLVEIRVRVTRDEHAIFRLYSKLPHELDWYLEGEVKHDKALKSKYFGLAFSNTTTTGSCYFFDDIYVSGNKIPDNTPPEIESIQIVSDNQLKIKFSEIMAVSDIDIIINDEYPSIVSIDWDDDFELVLISLNYKFSKGKKYIIQVENAFDEEANYLVDNMLSCGISEIPEIGDVVFNEVMFHHHESSAEYVEFYNRSDKVIDMSGMYFTTRKKDETLNTGIQFPENSLIFPCEYLAITENAKIVRDHHVCPLDAHIIEVRWAALNNENACLVLVDASKSKIFDEFTYHKNMHHALVKNPKGVALERIFIDLPTQDANNWHSAASAHNYGTPGFKNSQHKEGLKVLDNLEFYFENEYFTPDNDGINDISVLYYNLDKPGYIINIDILNAVGEHIYSLCKQYLANQEGFLLGMEEINKEEQQALVFIFLH